MLEKPHFIFDKPVKMLFFQHTSMKHILKLSIIAALITLYVSSCSKRMPASPSSAPSYLPDLNGLDSNEAAAPRRAEKKSTAEARPGLATGWGQERRSETYTTNFTRNGSPNTSSIYYNDEEGLEAATRGADTYKGEKWNLISGGDLEWGIKSQGRMLRSTIVNGQRVVAGKKGSAYSIVIRNKSYNDIETVVSVDGLDVLNGKSASIKNDGYIIKGKGDLEIEGFRTSTSTVAEFRFSSVAGSYAQQKHGNTRNVGVIGLAAYSGSTNSWPQPAYHSDLKPTARASRAAARPFAEAP